MDEKIEVSVTEYVARALSASDGGNFDDIGEIARTAYLHDANVAIHAFSTCLLSAATEEAVDKFRFENERGDPTSKELILWAITAASSPLKEELPSLSKKLVPGLTNESAPVLWADGEASDGKDHDIRNIRRTLAWLVSRALKKG